MIPHGLLRVDQRIVTILCLLVYLLVLFSRPSLAGIFHPFTCTASSAMHEHGECCIRQVSALRGPAPSRFDRDDVALLRACWFSICRSGMISRRPRCCVNGPRRVELLVPI